MPLPHKPYLSLVIRTRVYYFVDASALLRLVVSTVNCKDNITFWCQTSDTLPAVVALTMTAVNKMRCELSVDLFRRHLKHKESSDPLLVYISFEYQN